MLMRQRAGGIECRKDVLGGLGLLALRVLLGSRKNFTSNPGFAGFAAAASDQAEGKRPASQAKIRTRRGVMAMLPYPAEAEVAVVRVRVRAGVGYRVDLDALRVLEH